MSAPGQAVWEPAPIELALELVFEPILDPLDDEVELETELKLLLGIGDQLLEYGSLQLELERDPMLPTGLLELFMPFPGSEP